MGIGTLRLAPAALSHAILWINHRKIRGSSAADGCIELLIEDPAIPNGALLIGTVEQVDKHHSHFSIEVAK